MKIAMYTIVYKIIYSVLLVTWYLLVDELYTLYRFGDFFGS